MCHIYDGKRLGVKRCESKTCKVLSSKITNQSQGRACVQGIKKKNLMKRLVKTHYPEYWIKYIHKVKAHTLNVDSKKPSGFLQKHTKITK